LTRFGRRDEFEKNAIANATYRVEMEDALIKVIDPREYSCMFPQDIEHSLVHELLHVLLVPLEPEGGYYGAQEILNEQIINRAARALVDLKRERGLLTSEDIRGSLAEVTA
jgi:hypothetical protein